MARSGADELHWSRGAGGAAAAQREACLERVRRLIREGRRQPLMEALKRWPPLDLVELLMALRLRHARTLFFWLPDSLNLRVLAELKPELRDALFQDETVERLSAILRKLPPDEADAALERLPADIGERAIAGHAEAAAIRASRRHAEDTAGRVMTRKLLALPPETTVAEAVRTIRENAKQVGELNTLYVVDAERRLLGRLSLPALLLLPEETPIGEAMIEEPIAVSPDTDQEEALRQALKRNLPSLPVVDDAGHLVGRITVKQLRRIMQAEAEEDMMLMSGVSPDAESHDSVRRIIKGRLPWLLAGLFGATIAAVVVGSFEDELEKAAILAAFIPVCMSMAGNSGLQASAVAVQGIATGTIWEGDTLWRFLRELAAGLANGAAAGAIVALLALGGSFLVHIDAPHRLALSVFCSLIAVTTIAALVGASVPILLDKIGIDPALATGVFITTSNDVLGVLVFFLMATAFYF